MQVIWKNHEEPKISIDIQDIQDPTVSMIRLASAGRIYVNLCPYFWPYSIFRHLYQCIEDIKILPHQLGIKHATLNEGCMQSLWHGTSFFPCPRKHVVPRCTTLYHVVPRCTTLYPLVISHSHTQSPSLINPNKPS